MQTVSVKDAVAKLPELLEEARQGKPFSIVENGKASVRFEVEQPAPAEYTGSRIGFMKGEFTVPDDFDTMLDDQWDELMGLDE